MLLSGLAVGVLAATAVTRVARSLLFEISPLDPFAFTAAAAAMLVVALLAVLIPPRGQPGSIRNRSARRRLSGHARRRIRSGIDASAVGIAPSGVCRTDRQGAMTSSAIVVVLSSKRRAVSPRAPELSRPFRPECRRRS